MPYQSAPYRPGPAGYPWRNSLADQTPSQSQQFQDPSSLPNERSSENPCSSKSECCCWKVLFGLNRTPAHGRSLSAEPEHAASHGGCTGNIAAPRLGYAGGSRVAARSSCGDDGASSLVPQLPTPPRPTGSPRSAAAAPARSTRADHRPGHALLGPKRRPSLPRPPPRCCPDQHGRARAVESDAGVPPLAPRRGEGRSCTK